MTFPLHHPFRSPKAKKRFLDLYQQKAKEWPVVSEVKCLETSQGKTFVRISGSTEAPPLVLQHGMLTNSLMWIPNIAALSQSFRVYALDNIYDFGRSVYTRPFKASDDFMIWLDELFDALELANRINLMGLSYGGWLTSQYALHRPQRLEKIVLIAPALTVLPPDRKFVLKGVLSMIPHRAFVRSYISWLMEDLARGDSSDRLALEEGVNIIFTSMRCFKPKPMVNPTVLSDEELQSIKTPTLFIVGENEKMYSAEKALNRLHAVAPQIETTIIPKSGHDLSVVQSEMMVAKVLEFLNKPYKKT